MDAFKTAEVKRMEYGGNKPWKDFFNNHSSNKTIGRDFESCTIAERYDSEAGEEWKDRLTAKAEGTEYVPGSSRRIEKPAVKQEPLPTPSFSGSGRNTPLQNTRSAPQRTASPSQKARNEAYFASKGSENASRPDNLPPNQGGKYGGFGSAAPTSSTSTSNPGSIPTTDDFQKDPMAALTKGFGWLSSTVSKQAATINTSYIQPGIKNLNETDFAAQARGAAMQAGSFVQQGARGAQDQFNKFVDPDTASAPGGGMASAAGSARGVGGVQPEKQDFWDSFGQAPAGPPKERKDFWDDFAAAGEAKQQPASARKGGGAIGTSAMKTNASSSAPKKEDDEWGGW